MTSLPKKFLPFSPKRFRALSLNVLFMSLLVNAAHADGLPNIVGRDLSGKITSLHRTFDYKPMVVNFWWVKCSPCKQELPDLIAKERDYPNVDFVYVHAETNARTKAPYAIDEITGFLESQSLQLYRVIIGNTKARKSANIDALPTTLLLDNTGRIEQKLVGFTLENTAKISEWLAKQ